jgi:hypothetical protein
MNKPEKRMQKEQTEPITIVSGLPRSGTSMMMQMLEAAGISPLTDHLRAGDHDNPNGYYEFERVKALAKGDAAWIPQARGKAVKVISALLKHLPSDYSYRIVFMRRKMSEILASQRRMLQNRGEQVDKIDDDTMAALFEKHLEEVEAWLKVQPNLSCIFVDYNRLLNNPDDEIGFLGKFFEEPLSARKMISVVDPNLHRQKL